MTKHRTKRPIPDPSISALTRASTRQMLLPRAVLDTRIALREFLLEAGLKALLVGLEAAPPLFCGAQGEVHVNRNGFPDVSDSAHLVSARPQLRPREARVP